MEMFCKYDEISFSCLLELVLHFFKFAFWLCLRFDFVCLEKSLTILKNNNLLSLKTVNEAGTAVYMNE